MCSLLSPWCHSVPWRADGGPDGSTDTLAVGMVSTLLFQCFSTLQLQIISAQEIQHESPLSPGRRTTGLFEEFTNMLVDQYESSNAQPCRSKEWSKLTSVVTAIAAEVADPTCKH